MPLVNTDELERCGFCGRYFIDGKYIDEKEYSQEQLDNAPLGYCPEAPGEDTSVEQQYVTRDMAIDAGYPEMEGQPYYE